MCSIIGVFSLELNLMKEVGSMKEKELEELLGVLFGEIKVALIETCLHVENNCDISDLHNDKDKVIYTANVIKLSKTCQRVPAINQSCVGMIGGFCPLSEVP